VLLRGSDSEEGSQGGSVKQALGGKSKGGGQSEKIKNFSPMGKGGSEVPNKEGSGGGGL